MYSNLLDSIKLEMIQGRDIDKQDLQTGLNTLNSYINTLGSRAIGTNGDVLYQLITYIQSLTQSLVNQGITTPSMPSYTLYSQWTNNPDYTLQ
jgi:hypothetical protein